MKIFSGFNKKLIEAIKAIPYNRWDAKNKWWTVPFSAIFMAKLTAVCQTQNLKVILEEEPAGEAGVKRISPLDVPNYRRVPQSYINKHIELKIALIPSKVMFLLLKSLSIIIIAWI